jgi:acyl carrier protein
MQEALDDASVEAAVYAALRRVKPSLENIPMTPQTRFENLGLQSIEMISVVFEIEETFGVSIVDQQMDGFRTVAEARSVVQKLAQGKS